MKKRIQTLMFMTLMAFLFSGLTSLNAQSFTTGPIEYTGPNGKTQIEYLVGMDAINTLRTEMQSTFDLDNPVQPNSAANAAIYHHFQFMVHVQDHIGSGKTAGDAIFRAYNEVVEMAKSNYPNSVDSAWKDQLVTLLSI